ncbi:YoaK family protein [Actinomadura chokoriensis]|uniref:YoaK family protein n=1 Tax=Actinomadura chokoriensis TaxID=454156 RepID=A0ABV4QR16_9ACTN
MPRVRRRAVTPAGRTVILPGLALVSASTDAISYLGLGHVFTANMTGNTALLGIGIAAGKAGAALRPACALAGFVLGVVVSQLLVGRRRLLASCLAAELVPLAAWFGWWHAMDEPAHGPPRYGYILLAGIAMGLQSGAVTRLGVRGVTTVFITGTITSLTADLTGRLRGRPLPRPPSHPLQVSVLVFFLAGVVAGAYAFRYWGGTAALVPLGILAVLTAAACAQPPEKDR